jgi:transposase
MAEVGYGPPSVEKMLGSLPVIRDFLARLDVAATVDRLCPVRDIARLSHGQVIAALVANRLTSPTPLVGVEDWARTWAVPEMFDIPADALNDDRIGRALDALAPQAEAVIGAIGARAITAFGVDVARMHWDMTSISLYGAYPETDPEFAEPRFGHPKDRRPDLKQIQTGLAVSGDGGIPLVARAFDGGAAEVSQIAPAMRALRALAGPRAFLLVGDSKLVSYANLTALDAARVSFLAPAPKSVVPAGVLAALDLAAATPVDYTAGRDTGKNSADRGSYRVLEATSTLRGPRTNDPALTARTVFVHSSARANAAATARAKKLERARDDLARLRRALGSRHYPDTQAVKTRLAVIGKTRRVAAYLRGHTDTDPDTGKPTLVYYFDQAALDTETATDGWYALLTNLDPDDADPTEVLRRYKGQEVVERRYGAVKGPLAVAPMFLHDNRRIHALIHVICLALLIFSLIERAIRLAIAPAVTLPGLYTGRPAKPTGRLILTALASMRLTPARTGQPAMISRPRPLQQKILDLLGVDPRQPP